MAVNLPDIITPVDAYSATDGDFVSNNPSGGGGAGPNIAGVSNINGGAGRRLTGSGFGVGVPSFEFLGDPTGHIETTALGDDTDFGDWLLPSGGNDATKVIANDVSDINGINRGKVWYADQGGTDYNATARYDLGSDIPPDTDIYVTWWTKRILNAGANGQWKKLRISDINSITDHETELVYFHWDSGGSNLVSHTASGFTLFANTAQTDLQWYREEMIIKTSTVGVKDGNHQHYLHDLVSVPGLVDWGYSGDSPPEYPTIWGYETAERFRWFLFQNYRGNGNTDQEIWLDDMYIQTGSLARVEIGDSATYANCTHKEVQRISARSATVTDFVLNMGGMSTLSGKYAFLVIDDGTVSNGIAL